ncbi:sensor histidine kinase [Rhodococcus triatomae]|uniref:sensor histidine kinase n=1 Tax=Rhodococcus triatomae TaxID=300028 RepID=UPI001FEBDA59|nr:sensor histidine kinase [Rhodococcus triatomae]
MHRPALDPVFAGIRTSLHLLVVTLAGIVFVRAIVQDAQYMPVIAALSILFVAVYLAGASQPVSRPGVWWWLALLTALWVGLTFLAGDSAYIVFGLFFLYLHLLPRLWGLLAVAASTTVAVVGAAMHNGWSVAGIVGPVIGALVAVGIAAGYQALFREAAERQQLIEELMRTRAELAARERAAGTAAERERLAGDIHDTVAQGLSSIQLLLHAAERAAPDHPALERIRLARETAAQSLDETRQLIGDLTPAALDGQSLADALERICRQAATETLDTAFVVEGAAVRLPMPVEAALVRIAQGAVSNVVRHAGAARMAVTLTYSVDTVTLDVVDDGIGFDVDVIGRCPEEPAGPTSVSFGLASTRRRVEALHGTMSVESEPGLTAVAVSFPIGEES